MGMRHRAGIGMSENSDAVVVIVSEETGSISVAIGGMLKRHLQAETLSQLLHNELMPRRRNRIGPASRCGNCFGPGERGSRTMKKNDASRKAADHRFHPGGDRSVDLCGYRHLPEVTLKGEKMLPVEFSGRGYHTGRSWPDLCCRAMIPPWIWSSRVPGTSCEAGPQQDSDRSQYQQYQGGRQPDPDLRGGSLDNIRRGKLTVDSASIYSITVTVGELDSKEVPIQCEIVGSVADGYMAGGADAGSGGAAAARPAGRPAECQLRQGAAGYHRS